MNPTAGKPASSKGASEEGAFIPPPASREELISFARRYYAEDFRRPDRSECPTPADLRTQVHSGRLPDAPLRTHLFSCSDCFHAYQSAVAAQTDAASDAAPATTWQRAFEALKARPLVPVLAAAAALLLLLPIGLYVWRQSRTVTDKAIARQDPPPAGASENRTVAANNSDSVKATPAPSIQPTPFPTPKVGAPVAPAIPPKAPHAPSSRRPRRDPRGQAPEGSLIAAAPLRIDLEEYVITRGAGGSDDLAAQNGEGQTAGRIINLPRSRRTELLLTLPEGSEPGPHSVSIVDDSGKVMASARRTVSAGGKTLRTVFDTSRLDGRTYLLRISRRGTAPDFFMVRVKDERRAPR